LENFKKGLTNSKKYDIICIEIKKGGLKTMKVYVAYYYFEGLQYNDGECMGVFSSYEKSFESFREKYECFLECGNYSNYEDYVNDYGVIKELTLDNVLS